METLLDKDYWSNRYTNQQTGWDIGYVSTPLKSYIDQLTDKNIRILIPGGGNSYEAEYLYQQGFQNTFVVDLAAEPLQNLQNRIPEFPSEQLIQGNFFDLNQPFDLILEQTFFCALNPNLREAYVQKMIQLLQPTGKLVGVLFNAPLFTDHPPFGGNESSYRSLFEPYFHFLHFEICYNSIPPRAGNELFICFTPK